MPGVTETRMLPLLHLPALPVDLRLGIAMDHAIAASDSPIQVVRQPLSLEPVDGISPALAEGNDRLVAQVLLGQIMAEPAVHHQHLDAEGAQFQLPPHHQADGVANVGDEVHQKLRKVEFRQHRGQPKADSKAINLFPEKSVAIAVWMGVGVGANVELPQRWGVLVQSALAKDQPMAVVVHMGKADPVLAVAKHAQLACGRGFHEVRREQRISGPIDLVRRDGDGQQLVAAGLRDHKLAFCFGLSILL
mmetsp:Transcript_59964/g.140061  ORF Transcript_59964/g.140061 Transcript_59964/m.140061 type:complete len:248 (+) Transcript_59964:125-868(+)